MSTIDNTQRRLDRDFEQLRLMSEITQAGVLIVHKTGAIESVSPLAMNIFAHVFKYDAQELARTPIYELFPTVFLKTVGADGRPQVAPDPLYLDGELHETVAMRKNKEGFQATVIVREVILQDQPVYIVRVRDITARRQLENALKSRQQHLETILSVITSCVMSVNEQGTVTIHNQPTEQVFGYTSSELASTSIHQLLPQLFIETTNKDGGISVSPKPEYLNRDHFEISAERKNKQKFPADVSIRQIDLDGKFFYVVRVLDITERKQAEAQLRLRQRRVEILLDATKAALLTVEPHGAIESYSASAREVFGYGESELQSLTIDKLVPAVFSLRRDKGAPTVTLDPLFADKNMHDTTALRKGRGKFPATIMVNQADLEGKPLYVVRVRDITERKGLEDALRTQKQRMETILDNAAEGILTFGEHGVIESFNHAAEKLFGYPEREVLGKTISLVMPPEARDSREGYLEHFMRAEINRLIGHEGEVVGRHQDGTRFPMALKISTMEIDGKKLYTGLVADISERKAMVENLKNMAEHDGLTGLYNRGYFQGELERVVERSKRAGSQPCALLYIDLDNFKYVNDTFGHAAGDRVLLEVAGILSKRARKSDLIARLGGDEFAVLLYNAKPDQAAQVAESFREQMGNYVFKQNGERIDIGCSIGVSLIGQNTTSAGEVMSQADIACHLAKRAGRNRIHIFKAADEKGLANMSLDMGWSRRIREAIKDNRFALACQPILNVRTGEIDSYEVLIRMLDDNNELIMPSGFMPSAERFGLMADIDKWVIANAIETLAQQRKTLPHLRYSINLSGQTLSDLSVADLILAKLHATGLEASALIFEVTETVAIADMKVAEIFLARLQAIGCETALDDFGSGFSSFAYLRDLPVDTVKIDGRFVKNLAKNPVDQVMVKAMNDIAHALGKHTVAEFVENAESMQLLKEYGVDYAQGYHLGRPDVVLPCKAIAENAREPGMCKVG